MYSTCTNTRNYFSCLHLGMRRFTARWFSSFNPDHQNDVYWETNARSGPVSTETPGWLVFSAAEYFSSGILVGSYLAYLLQSFFQLTSIFLKGNYCPPEIWNEFSPIGFLSSFSTLTNCQESSTSRLWDNFMAPNSIFFPSTRISWITGNPPSHPRCGF